MQKPFSITVCKCFRQVRCWLQALYPYLLFYIHVTYLLLLYIIIPVIITWNQNVIFFWPVTMWCRAQPLRLWPCLNRHTAWPPLNSVTMALQADVNNATSWFKVNFLQANPEKFQVMYLKPISNSPEVPESFTIADTTINTQPQVKLLGIIIDDKLSFEKQIDIMCKRASRQLNIMRRFKYIFQLKEMSTIYNAFILSNFNYCPVVWHFCSITNMRKLEKIQERALRLLYDDPASSYQELLTRSGHSSLHVRRLRMIAMEVYKSLNNINPEFMWELFQKKETEYNFRDSFKVDIPSFKTLKYGKYSFSYYGAHLWNILPINIKQSLSQTNFKMVLSSWDGPNCSCSYCDFKPWDL